MFESLPYRHSTQINLYAFCLSLSVRTAATAAAASARLSSLRPIYKMHIFCLCFFDWQRHMYDILYTALHLCVCASSRRLGTVSQYPIASHFKPKSCKKMCVCNWREALDDDVAAAAETVVAACWCCPVVAPPVLRSFIVGPLTRTRTRTASGLWRARCTFRKSTATATATSITATPATATSATTAILLHFSYMLQFIFPLGSLSHFCHACGNVLPKGFWHCNSRRSFWNGTKIRKNKKIMRTSRIR